jgi:putative oxidoreductase
MLYPELNVLTDLVILVLRILMGILFFTSGWSHARKPRQRAESIGMSPTFTLGLGVVEMAAALSITLGIFAQVGALLLMGVMVGAIHKKMLVWKSGFWGKKSSGWYYDVLYFWISALILTTGGGAYVLI